MEIKLNPDVSIEPDETAPQTGAPGQPEQPTLYVEPGTESPAPAPSRVNPADLVKESDTPNFSRDVIEESVNQPVVVDFWAPWCGPCKQLGPALEKLVRQAGGLVKMVKINVDENQQLAAQMRVQSIPAVYAFKDGQPVDGFMGALPESQLKTFLDRLLGGAKPPLEGALDMAREALEAGDAARADQIYREVQAEDPENAEAIGGIIRAAVLAGDTETAKGIAESLTDALKAKPEIADALSALELAGLGGDGGDLDGLIARVAADENDHQARFDLANALCGAGRNEEGVDELLEIIRRDRGWNEEAARTQLLKVFEALGAADPVTQAGRRRLSSILFS